MTLRLKNKPYIGKKEFNRIKKFLESESIIGFTPKKKNKK